MTYQKSLSELQFKVAKTILIASVCLFIPIICFDLSLGFYGIALLKVPVIGVMAFAYFKLMKVGFKERYTHVVNFSVLAFFVLNYLGNQGTDGPSLYASMSMFVIYPILLSNKWKWTYAIITIAIGITLLFIGIDKSNLIQPEYENPVQQFVDHASSYSIMGIYVLVLVSMVLDFYKKQNLDLAMAQALLKEQMELVQKEKRKKENLLGILAHDVKTPVNNLGDLFMLYQEDSINKEDFKELMKSTQSRIEDLQGTIDGILGQLNTEIKQEKSKDGTGNPVFATERVIKLLQYKFDAKKQHVRFNYADLSSNPLTINDIANQLYIILKNLLDNAHKYSNAGSTITVSLRENGKQLIWEIDDQGPGISAEKQKQLFNNTFNSDQGSGMGLYLCQSLAESIGATITYHPQSQGSLFRLVVLV